MATFTNARDLARKQRGQVARVLRALELANKQAAEVAMAEAVKLSKGSQRTPKELRKAGHPFAKNRLRSIGAKFGGKSLMQAFPLLPIGRNGGGFAGGWKIVERKSGSGKGWRLVNTDPKAPFLLSPGGTKHMVDRGFVAELRKRVAAKVRALHRRALKDALKD